MSTNTRVKSFEKILTPRQVIDEYSISQSQSDKIQSYRKIVQDILDRKDHRLIVVVGPCSIHDYDSAIDYARQLKSIVVEYPNLFIIMRVYFEKPRTTVGWKGFINDPDLNDTYNLDKGLRLARRLMVEITRIGLPIGCEFLDVFTPQYISDLVTWGAIGARTCESQIHRQLASGLSMPVGFKNTTTGEIQHAVDGMISSSYPHIFLGIDQDAKTCKFSTTGNEYTHIILRGSTSSPNYKRKYVERAVALQAKHRSIMIDCSHDNSRKQYTNQRVVLDDIIRQISTYTPHNILGVMIESNINPGKQRIGKDLKYGISITDGCVGFDETGNMLRSLNDCINIRSKL
jgi:3-deoxy-7-phosphoheptulonate synthase